MAGCDRCVMMLHRCDAIATGLVPMTKDGVIMFGSFSVICEETHDHPRTDPADPATAGGAIGTASVRSYCSKPRLVYELTIQLRTTTTTTTQLVMSDKMMNGRQEQQAPSERSLGAQLLHGTTEAAMGLVGSTRNSVPSFASSSVDIGSSSSLDIPAGTFDENRATARRPSTSEDEAARKERKRLKKERKKHSSSKDPEAKRKEKEKKAKKEKRRKDKDRISGDSGESCNCLGSIVRRTQRPCL